MSSHRDSHRSKFLMETRIFERELEPNNSNPADFRPYLLLFTPAQLLTNRHILRALHDFDRLEDWIL